MTGGELAKSTGGRAIDTAGPWVTSGSIPLQVAVREILEAFKARERDQQALEKNKEARDLSKVAVVMELNLLPGQVLSCTDLPKELNHFGVLVRYAEGTPKYKIVEERKEGWGGEFRCRPTDGKDGAFHVLMRADSGTNRRDEMNQGSLQFLDETGRLAHAYNPAMPVVDEFRMVLQVCYSDSHQGHTNIPRVPIARYHNADFYSAGIVLHIGHDSLPGQTRMKIFETALGAYFSAKGYPVETVPLGKLHQEQAAKLESRGLELEQQIQVHSTKLDSINSKNLSYAEVKNLDELLTLLEPIAKGYTDLRSRVQTAGDVHLDTIRELVLDLPLFVAPTQRLSNLNAYGNGLKAPIKSDNATRFEEKLQLIAGCLAELFY
jgi:hypothetical protein